MIQKLDREILDQAKDLSNWLRKNQNPYVRIEITDSEVKVTSVNEFIPLTEVDEN